VWYMDSPDFETLTVHPEDIRDVNVDIFKLYIFMTGPYCK
jgi:hypothetical protein